MNDIQDIGLRIGDLEDENARLRAEIDNLQAARSAPTILDILGQQAFDRMVELYPSFRESGTPTRPTDVATEVLWSCIRMMGRTQKEVQDVKDSAKENYARYSDLAAKNERATNALAEYAMRAAEGGDQ